MQLNQYMHRSFTSPSSKINSIKSPCLHNSVGVMTPTSKERAKEATIDWVQLARPELFTIFKAVINGLILRDHRMEKRMRTSEGQWQTELSISALQAAVRLPRCGFYRSALTNKDWKIFEKEPDHRGHIKLAHRDRFNLVTFWHRSKINIIMGIVDEKKHSISNLHAKYYVL